MKVVCVSCGVIAEADTYCAEGVLCAKCRLSASTVFQVFVIGSNVYVATLKRQIPIAVEAVPAKPARKAVAS